MARLNLRQQASLIAGGIVNPQLALFKSQIAAQQAEEQRKFEAARGIGEAIAKASASTPGNIQQAFSSAGRDIAGFNTQVGQDLGVIARAPAEAASAQDAAVGIVGGGVTSAISPAVGAGMADVYGVGPGSSLAAEGADRYAAAKIAGDAMAYGWGQQALTALHAGDPQIAQWRGQMQALEATRGAEKLKAWLSLRDDARQQAAEAMQEKQANRAWLNTLFNRADALTQTLGTLHVVKNGRVVNTGRPAAGSTAAKVVADTQQAAAELRYKQAQDRIQNSLDLAKVNISQQQADAATRREAAYSANLRWHQLHPNAKKGSGPGGMSDAEVRQYSKSAGITAYSFFKGIPNKNYGKVDSNGDPLPGSTQRYATKPASAAETLRYMLANGVPYTIAWRAIKQYASLPNSWWKDALKWHAGSESPRGRR